MASLSSRHQVPFRGIFVTLSGLIVFSHLFVTATAFSSNHPRIQTTTSQSTPPLEAFSRNDNLEPVEANLDRVGVAMTESRRDFMMSVVAAAGVAAVGVAALGVDEAAATEDTQPLSLQKEVEKDGESLALASSEVLASSSEAAVDWEGILQKAGKKALGGGKAGASAAVVQVCSLMWLRTTMNYQYRYGGTLVSALRTLWSEGGVPRFYQGLPFALVQGPMTRFGDTAANVGILALLESIDVTASLPLPLKTACGSATAGLWRICLMPVDTSKTAMQVEGRDGLERLWTKVGKEGPAPLYQGALASAAATAVGHFPWFLTYNFLNDIIPQVSATDDLLLSLARSALLGLCSSCVSDTCSNSLRVVKTTKQTAGLGAGLASAGAKDGEAVELSYRETLELILEKDGFQGLFGRGLKTRLLTNAIQGALFTVLWRYFQQTGVFQ